MADDPDPDEDEWLEDESSGWDAIDDSLRAIYGDQPPRHYGTILRYALGGPDPVDGISVYLASAPREHWHYVTYGFSELYEKESDEATLSGWGYELTLRLARGPEHDPPNWPLRLLQALARHVFGNGAPFAPGDLLEGDLVDHLTVQGTALCALGVAEDPLLPERETPNGRLRFLQLVGLSADELETAERGDLNTLFEHLAEQHPLLVTDLTRASILEDEAVFRALRDLS